MDKRVQCGVPAGSQTVMADGVKIAVVREGRGPAVVCLHAVGHGGRDYAAFAERMKGHCELIRIDWPGQGRSGPDTQPASAARYAQLLALVLEALQIREPVLIGNSIGGAAAVIHAAAHPVRALVLCNAGGLVQVNAFVRGFCRVFAAFFDAGARGARWYMPLFRAYYRWLVLPQPAAGEQRERIIASGYEIAPLLRDAWRSFGRADADIRQQARVLTMPVWVAWAENDRVIPLSFCLPCIRAMRDAQLSRYRGGHAAFLEQPDAFAKDFFAFLQRCGLAGGPAQSPA